MKQVGFLKTSLLSLSLALGAAFAGSATAAPQTVSNGTFSVTYNDATPFGTLTLVGNAISFDLVDTNNPGTPWIAQSLGGQGPVAANGTATLTLTIHDAAYAAGFRFGAFDWLEGGDYYLNEASSSVRVAGQLHAVDTRNPGLTTTTNDLTLLAPGLGTVGANTNWFATARLDSSTACGGSPNCVNVFTTDAQEIRLKIENRLLAISTEPLTSEAFIEKKLGAGAFTLAVSPIPEPGTWATMAAGLVLVGALSRRRLKSGSTHTAA